MSSSINRRNWLKSGMLLSAGLAAGNWTEVLAESRRTKKIPQMLPSGLLEHEAPDIPPMKARLLANENPFGPSDKAKQAIKDAIDTSFRYGWEGKREFVNLIAEKEGVTPDHILLGAGSTELLNAASWYFALETEGKIISGDLTYDSLIRTAAVHGAGCDRVPLTSDFKLDLKGMADGVHNGTSMVYICNPNNPTGTTVDSKELEDFCMRVSKKTPIFIDEAYIDFTDNPEEKSMIKCIRKGYDIMVARTFSKLHAFAGLRIGYLVALPATITKIKEYASGGGTISAPSSAAAVASYQDTDYHKYAYDMNNKSKGYLYKTLEGMGMEYIPSETSFVLFPIAVDAQAFRKQMFEKGVGIQTRNYKDQDYCRVSIGTMDEMKVFTKALKEIVA
ncbi:pyridoxal phosphate-dependent aminotransferase [Chondrinema litorale]|uniref:pyridoxal phosphate-dependent aminotransferase n=1 Tax=Chondrinema litorale TaxID=2994555 RepID=UPI0025436B48|nr:aminotransferase class I/II-fold pyridoxal phosphate-dependent enzyme [Chondrinema litorale]UZR92792.1 aminotransferase class I/II-fold pyridoxal phosphate-dependent enzyme [Chondrinema litorale]